MNDFERFTHAAPKEGSEAESEVRELLQAAGARPELPPEDFARLKAAARAEWRASTQGGGRGWALGLAMAASLVLAMAAAWWWWGGGSTIDGTAIAAVLRVDGVVLDATGQAVARGAVLAAGSEIETSAGTSRVALRLDGGGSVRLDASTRIRLTAGDRLDLERGAIYFDSAGAAGDGGIEIGTAFGTVRDIGTQFEVRLREQGDGPLRVRVREGAVSLQRGGESRSVSRGEELRLGRDGVIEVDATALHGPDWAWVLEVAPSFEIDGQPLDSYLEWVARETGWTILFEDPTLEAAATRVRLGGTIETLTPSESLDVVLPGSGMDYRFEDGVVKIVAGDDV